MAEITDDECDRAVVVNLKGVWNCMKFEIKQMLKQRGGAVVNTSSQGGEYFAGQAYYISCKHGVITRMAAVDFASKGIRINAVCLTPMANESMRRNPDLEKELVSEITGRTFRQTRRITDAVFVTLQPRCKFCARPCFNGRRRLYHPLINY